MTNNSWDCCALSIEMYFLNFRRITRAYCTLCGENIKNNPEEHWLTSRGPYIYRWFYELIRLSIHVYLLRDSVEGMV